MRNAVAMCFLVAIAFGIVSCSGSNTEQTTTGPPATTAIETTLLPETPPTIATTVPEVASVRALDWVPCGEAECAVLMVPLGHRDPAAGRIGLQVARRLADQAQSRIGALFYNPGGAGAAGTPFVEAASAWFGSELLNRFDLVSWDPRGVSAGTELDCFNDPDEFLSLDPTPETTEEAADVTARLRSFAAECAERSGNLLPHLSTMATARDMDRLRQALGEEQISYLGQSYGTALGLVYATLFPDRLRAMVLDGFYDLDAPLDELLLRNAAAEAATLEKAMVQCAVDEHCPFHNNGDPSGALEDLLAHLDLDPIAVGDTDLNLLRALDAIWWILLQDDQSILMKALARAQQGDGELLASWSEFDADNGRLGLRGWYAINCLDRSRKQRSMTEEEYARIVAASPWLGTDEWIDNEVCRAWGAEPDPPPPPAPGDAPILIVSATGDIATPLASGLELSRRLDNDSLLVVERNAHPGYAPLLWTGVVDGDAQCVTTAVHRFLIELQLPADQSICVHGRSQPLPPGSIAEIP